MPEQHKEENGSEDLSSQEKDIEEFRKALKKLGSKRQLSPQFHGQLRERIKQGNPDKNWAVDRLIDERKKDHGEHNKEI